MSNEVAISVRGLSKSYTIEHGGLKSPSFREAIVEKLKHPLRRRERETFWALNDVSFDIKRGDVVGIVGRNGAGKSTLLKILSRIVEPTLGEVDMFGRVASLLEVGTGFHPELTGRENIYLNGAILGMRRDEIRRHFDEIVDFAEVERFLDTPVKRYSSGMYVRLAFAVAAHLNPEILIVDEVLAVGDAEFQKKCLGKMREASKSHGRTVLFVSHNMQAVSLLCRNAVMLERGTVVHAGPAEQVVEYYRALGTHDSAEKEWSPDTAPGNEYVALRSVKVCNPSGTVSFDQKCGVPITVNMEFVCHRAVKLIPNFHLHNQSGVLVFVASTTSAREATRNDFSPGLHRCSCVIPAPLLNAGRYTINFYLSRETDGLAYASAAEAVSFQVMEDGTGLGAYTGAWPGTIRPTLSWRREQLGERLVVEQNSVTGSAPPERSLGSVR